MNCLSRSSQAVRPVTSRIEQVNRAVTRKTNTDQNFTVCIFFFFFYLSLLLYYFKNLFMGKYMELCILYFLGVESNNVKTNHS